MTSNILVTVSSAAETFRWILGQELCVVAWRERERIINHYNMSISTWKCENHVVVQSSTHSLADILCFLAQALWIWNIMVGNCSKQLLLILAVKRWLADQHLVDVREWTRAIIGRLYGEFMLAWARDPIYLVQENTVSPPVNRLAIRLIQNDLRCNVVGRATECLGGFIAGDVFFAHAKIGYLYVTIWGNKEREAEAQVSNICAFVQLQQILLREWKSPWSNKMLSSFKSR